MRRKKKEKQILHHMAALLFVIGMFTAAMLLKEQEVIFPEILAVLIGAVVAERQPWNVSKGRMIAVMTLASVIGTFISAQMEGMLYVKVMFGLLVSLLLLILSKTSMIPLVSACILPIMVGTTQWIYPAAVFVMITLITGIQLVLEKTESREAKKYRAITLDRAGANLWMKRYLILGLLLIVPLVCNLLYMAVPPLLVLFIELSQPNHPLRKRQREVMAEVVLAALLGAAGRCVLSVWLGVAPVLSAAGVTFVLLWIMNWKKLFLAPAGAIAMLPFILPQKGLFWYPAEVTVGVAILLPAAGFVLADWVKDGRYESEF